MVLLASTVLCLLIVLLTGGKVSGLAGVRFKGLHFLVAAICIRLLLAAPLLGPWLAAPLAGDLRYGGALYILSLFVTLLALVSNWHVPGLKLVSFGMFLNFLVIAANLGQMPSALHNLGITGYAGPRPGEWSTFVVMDEDTPLWFLGDNFPVPPPWPLRSLVSLGDLVIVGGIFWFLQKVMKAFSPRTRQA